MTLDEIIDQVGGEIIITVDVTPDGHGDCVRPVATGEDQSDDAVDSTLSQVQNSTRRMFVKPYEERMSLDDFRDMLRADRYSKQHDNKNINHNNSSTLDDDDLTIFPLRRNRNGDQENTQQTNTSSANETNPPIVYYSRQNDCLRTELTQLFSSNIFPKSFTFAEEAFGTGPPDAINIWIGNERSVSSMHKDHYENLFYVCSGQKEFILCPPADVLFLHEGEFPSGKFNRKPSNAPTDDSIWVVEPDCGEDSCEDEVYTKWIEPDIKTSLSSDRRNDSARYPLLSRAHPIKVLLSEGEMLYLPSLWYHRVTQTCETVGVNYWFDMKFDSPHWCYFNLLQNMKSSKQR